MYYIFFAIKQKENKELSKDIFRVFQHKLSCHVPSAMSTKMEKKNGSKMRTVSTPNVFQVKILSDSGSDLQNTLKNTPPKFFP